MSIEETLKNLTVKQLKSLLPCQSAATEILIKSMIEKKNAVAKVKRITEETIA